MSLITEMRLQKAVWWKRSASPDEFGRYNFAEPVEIDCRWVDARGQFRNAKGEAQDSRAVIYVDREMDVGDMLKKGEMDTGTTPLDPSNDGLAYPIIFFGDTPDFDNLEHLYTVHL